MKLREGSLTALVTAWGYLLMSNVLYPQLDLALQYETGGDLSNFMPNGEWSLIGAPILE